MISSLRSVPPPSKGSPCALSYYLAVDCRGAQRARELGQADALNMVERRG
jgi:hypothetical protein